MSLPVVIFDTSALNKLIKGGQSSEPHLAALNCGFDVWLTAMNVEEIIATPVAETREKLVAGLQRLLISGRCVWPPHWILTLLCSAHTANPNTFDWRRSNIEGKEYERAIINRDFEEELCQRQLVEQRSLEHGFMEFWKQLRAKLDPLWENDPKKRKRPTKYSQAAKIARTANPNLLLGIGAELYQRGAKTATVPSDADLETFMKACPPFEAICYGMLGSWFDVSLARQVFRELPGRNDQMMAVYLPYCSRFVSDDWRQEERLREIATEAKLDCEVLSYADFLASFEVMV
jgi:hypothetical protein